MISMYFDTFWISQNEKTRIFVFFVFVIIKTSVLTLRFFHFVWKWEASFWHVLVFTKSKACSLTCFNFYKWKNKDSEQSLSLKNTKDFLSFLLFLQNEKHVYWRVVDFTNLKYKLFAVVFTLNWYKALAFMLL